MNYMYKNLEQIYQSINFLINVCALSHSYQLHAENIIKKIKDNNLADIEKNKLVLLLKEVLKELNKWEYETVTGYSINSLEILINELE